MSNTDQSASSVGCAGQVEQRGMPAVRRPRRRLPGAAHAAGSGTSPLLSSSGTRFYRYPADGRARSLIPKVIFIQALGRRFEPRRRKKIWLIEAKYARVFPCNERRETLGVYPFPYPRPTARTE